MAAVATPVVATITGNGHEASADCVCGRRIILRPGHTARVHADTGRMTCPTN